MNACRGFQALDSTYKYLEVLGQQLLAVGVVWVSCDMKVVVGEAQCVAVDHVAYIVYAKAKSESKVMVVRARYAFH